MTKTIDELREGFEIICYKNKWNTNKWTKDFAGFRHGDYVDDFVNGAWWMYQELNK